MTSAGHRTAFAQIGRAPDDFCLRFVSYDSNGSRLSGLASNSLILITCFLWRMMENVNINVFIITRENSCKISRAPYGARSAFAHIRQAPDDFCLRFISYNSNGARLSGLASNFLITCFLWRMMANVSGWSLTTPAGHRTTCPAGHRPMFSYTDADRRPCNMWIRKRKFIKIVRCPGDYQIRRWCANRWNRTMSVLFVTIA